MRMRLDRDDPRASTPTPPTRCAASCFAGHVPRRGRNVFLRYEYQLIRLRHVPCFRCATDAAPLIFLSLDRSSCSLFDGREQEELSDGVSSAGRESLC